jgi:hypothetical protein
VKTLPKLVKDGNNPEKVAEMPIDHCYDGTSYGLMSRHAARSAERGADEMTEVQRMKTKLAGAGGRRRRMGVRKAWRS